MKITKNKNQIILKKDTQLENIYDLKLLKYKLKADIRLQEELLRTRLLRLKASYSDQIKTSAIHYSQKIIATLIYRLIHSRFE